MFQRWCEVTDSTAVKELDYDPENQIMRVTFVHGATWDYKNVPSHIYGLIVSSNSPGNRYNRLIKGTYEGEKVEQPNAA